jgi:uncharacterized protein (UPF0335 family)
MDLVILIAGISVLLCGLFLAMYFAMLKKHRLLHEQVLSERKVRVDVEQRLSDIEESIHEVRTGAIGMGSKLKEVSADIHTVKLKQEELQQLDPEMRLYSRATKLVSSGASIEEIMAECELPRGEAEMLLSLHKNL